MAAGETSKSRGLGAPQPHVAPRYTPAEGECEMAELEPYDQFAMGVTRDTWALLKRDPFLYLIAGLVVSLLSAVSLGLVAGPLSAGFIELTRRARRGEPLEVGIVFSRFDTLIPGAVAFTLITLALLVGFCLLLVPGLIVAVATMFTLQVITYENTTGVSGIRRSYALVRAHVGHALVLLLLVALLHGLGSLLILGMFVTVPLSLIPLTIGYERLTGVRAAEVLTL
jgi:hypothetical protein